jgi:hypothetical protein
MALPDQALPFLVPDQVLDLDETLVHSTLDGCDAPDFSFPVSFNNREHRCARPLLSAPLTAPSVPLLGWIFIAACVRCSC